MGRLVNLLEGIGSERLPRWHCGLIFAAKVGQGEIRVLIVGLVSHEVANETPERIDVAAATVVWC